MKTNAEKKLNDLEKLKPHYLLDALIIATAGSYSNDETCSNDRVSTFIFIYSDESELRIDTEGNIYANNDPIEFNIFRIK